MEYNQDNVFAKIIRGEIHSKKIYEDEHVIAIEDVAPAAPIHILVIPKAEYTSFHDFMEKAEAIEIAHFYKVVQKICTDLKIEKDGYRIMCNIGKNGMQTVPHMHLHILAGKPLSRIGI